jgi:cytochrome c biogenesis protein CcdA
VTHADLFFENPVKLPFLNIELPLLAFFFLAPILFLIVPAYTLVHLVMLTDKAKRYDTVLRQQIGDENAAVRDSLRRQLPSNIFVQFLVGPEDVRASAFGRTLRAIAWITLVIGPVLLLLMMQIQFLPFHNGYIIWTHRFALLADLSLVWWLWRKILSGRETSGPRRAWARRVWTGTGLALSVAAVLFSGAVAIFPGEWQKDHLAGWRIFEARDQFGQPEKVSLHDLLFNLPVDHTSRRRNSIFSSTLVLPGLNIYEGLKIDDPEKVKGRDFVFRARGAI